MSNLVAQVYLSPGGSATINIYAAGVRHDFVLVGSGTRWGLAHTRAVKACAPDPQGHTTLAALVEAAYFGVSVPPKNFVGPMSGRWILRDENRKVFVSGWILERPAPRRPSK